MAVIAGYTGQLDMADIVDSDVAYNVHAWSADVTCDELDSTVFQTPGWRTKVAGLKSWSASVEIYTDGTYRIVPSDMGSIVACKLYINTTVGVMGNGMITGWTINAAVDGLETTTLAIAGTSDLFELA